MGIHGVITIRQADLEFATDLSVDRTPVTQACSAACMFRWL